MSAVPSIPTSSCSPSLLTRFVSSLQDYITLPYLAALRDPFPDPFHPSPNLPTRGLQQLSNPYPISCTETVFHVLHVARPSGLLTGCSSLSPGIKGRHFHNTSQPPYSSKCTSPGWAYWLDILGQNTENPLVLHVMWSLLAW